MSDGKEHTVKEFITSPLWDKARWIATTFRWHPTGGAPPVMALCFQNGNSAHELFSKWAESGLSANSLRVSIIEGEIPGEKFGYSIQICADLAATVAQPMKEGAILDSSTFLLPSRVNRMHPAIGLPPLIPRFRQDYEKHHEFLLAPATYRSNKQLWIDVELGIVMSEIHFRNAVEIGENDIDSTVLRSPIPPTQWRHNSEPERLRWQ